MTDLVFVCAAFCKGAVTLTFVHQVSPYSTVGLSFVARAVDLFRIGDVSFTDDRLQFDDQFRCWERPSTGDRFRGGERPRTGDRFRGGV